MVFHEHSAPRPDLASDTYTKATVGLITAKEARTPRDMDRPRLRLPRLKGERRGQWSVWVSGNWRLVFRFEAGEAVQVDLVDYHGR